MNLNAEIRLPAGIERKLARLAFGSKTRERCWRKLATHQRHRMPIDESLRLFAKQARAADSLSAQCYTLMRDRLSAGKNMRETLAGLATLEEILLIHSSQIGGKLSEGLLLAADLLAAKRKVIGAVIGAVAYPAFLFALVVVVLYAMSVVISPQLTAITDPTHWQGPAAILYRISRFVDSSAGLFALLALVGALILVFVTLPLWAGTGRLWADRIPPWSVYRLLVGVSWLHTVATLMSVGQKPVDILAAMLTDHSTTPYLRNILRRINNHVGRGSNLGDALEKTGLRWPSPELVEELQAYSNLPGFGEQIRAIAADWLTDGIALIVRAARALNIICILMVGGLVILMVTGITSIQQQIAIGIGG